MIVGFISMAAVILLALLRVPLGIALMSVSLAGLAYITSTTTALTLFPMTVSEAVLSYDLAIVPMFILMGNIISRTGIAQDLFRAANAYLGSVRGGLSLATMVTCAGFGAVCGSSYATAATMAKVAYPSMRRYGYSDGLAAATIAAGGVAKPRASSTRRTQHLARPDCVVARHLALSLPVRAYHRRAIRRPFHRDRGCRHRGWHGGFGWLCAWPPDLSDAA